MKTIFVTLLALLMLTPATLAEAGSNCNVIDHRAGAGPKIDDNTLEGLKSDARKGFMSEVDGRVLLNGYTIYHENVWQNYTTGVGTPENSTVKYVKTLKTLDNGQSVPVMGDVITQTRRTEGLVMMEFDEPDSWTVKTITGLINRLRAGNIWHQWAFTGTKGALLRLKSVAPRATVMYRLDGGEYIDANMAKKYGIDILAVGNGFSKHRVTNWRHNGYDIWGRQTDPKSYSLMYNKGIRTLQTGAPHAWMSFCRSQ